MYQCTSPLSAIFISHPGETESADDTSCLKEAIGGGYEICPVFSSAELEVLNERRLPCKC